jgi:hypothetical protein
MRPSQTRGWYGGSKTAGRDNGIKWRVMVELAGSDGTVLTLEISIGGSNTVECPEATIGLTLADGKRWGSYSAPARGNCQNRISGNMESGHRT